MISEDGYCLNRVSEGTIKVDLFNDWIKSIGSKKPVEIKLPRSNINSNLLSYKAPEDQSFAASLTFLSYNS